MEPPPEPAPLRKRTARVLGGSRRLVQALFGSAVVLVAASCGRRGPPQPPIQVTPEAPRLLPLRQEGGEIAIRWVAPRLAEGGEPGDLRLRKALVLYRVVDIRQLAAEQRASSRSEIREASAEAAPDGAGPLETEAGETAPGGEAGEGAVSPETGEEEAGAPGTGVGTEDPPVDAPEVPSPTATESAAAAEPPLPAPPDPAVPEVPGLVGEGSPSGESGTEAAIPSIPESEEGGSEAPAPSEPEAEVPLAAKPAPETAEPSADSPVESVEDSDPAEIQLQYEEMEFEVLAEVESRVAGEERSIEWPVDPAWIGRRFEVEVRYEARGGPSEASDPQSLDLTERLPAAEGVEVSIGEKALTVRWSDPRPTLGNAAELSDPLFEVFRRRGDRRERVGRSVGPNLSDPEVVWGEEVCYQIRVLFAGDDEERVLPDPGPEFAPALSGKPETETGSGGGPEVPVSTEQRAAPVAEGAPSDAPPVGPGGPEGATDIPDWTPVLVRIPPTSSRALSVGPFSEEGCAIPRDVFPPSPPTDLRLFWRPESTELLWKESISDDLAGYHIYRSAPDGSGSERLTDSPLERTTFRDSERDPRARFRYSVTAVDSAEPANESPQTAPALASPRR